MAENRLLKLLSSADAGLPMPTAVDFKVGQSLEDPGTPALYTYFPVTCVASLVSRMNDGTSAEVSLVGREGVIGLSAILGPITSPTSAQIQVPGTAMRLPAAALRAARSSNAFVRRVLDLYTEACLIELAQTAACNRLHSVQDRLARWLLAMYKRIDGDSLTISQETIGDLLGVHRPTVSIALRHFLDSGALRRHGRALIIANHEELEASACECHQLIERETDRLFAQSPVSVESLLIADPPSRDDGRSSAALEATREIAGRLLLASIREQEARAVAEAANRTKDQFLAMVSHELRTPLTAILGWCATLADGREPLERGLRVIESNARAQLRLVEDLLDAVRVTAGTLTIVPASVSLRPLLLDVIETVGPLAAEQHVEIRTKVSHELPNVVIDAHRIRQVLLDVIGNSLKFTNAGGAIDVDTGADEEHVHISVRDTGQGIAPDVLPHVFDLFGQGKDGELGGRGLGLGLATARAVIERHGGTIDLDSPGENQGTTCRIRLPRVAVAAAPTAGEAS